MLIKAGSGLAGTAEASSSGVTKQTANDTLICKLGDLDAVKAIFEAHKNDIAGIIIEPLAIFGRSQSKVTSSSFATNFISSVATPLRAALICVPNNVCTFLLDLNSSSLGV